METRRYRVVVHKAGNGWIVEDPTTREEYVTHLANEAADAVLRLLTGEPLYEDLRGLKGTAHAE